MLLCALLVWAIFPNEYIKKNDMLFRKTYLTEAGCHKDLIQINLKNKKYCLLIDKRIDFSFEEWRNDNCFRSENKWIGK